MNTSLLVRIHNLFLSSFLVFIVGTPSYGFQVDRLTLSVCTDMGGEMVDQIQCPNKDRLRKGHFCKLSDSPFIFFNGCSIGVGFYRETFFPACMKHDLCYHHQPSTSGKSRKDCDREFKNNMGKICDSLDKNRKGCRVAARMYYSSVRVGGNRSWLCSDVALENKVPSF